MEKPNYYAIISASVRYDHELSANAKLLYGEITALCDKYGYCFATNDYFSKLYNVSTKSISSWINDLKNKGHIEVEMLVQGGRRIFLGGGKKLLGGVEENFHHNNTSNIKENNNINIITKESPPKFKKPTIEEIEKYCSERKNNIDAEYFYHHYESIGWMVGKFPMKNWKSCIITWEKNSRKYNKTNDEEIKEEKSIVQEEDIETKKIRYRCGYVAGVFSKEELEEEGIELPTEEEYEDIRRRI